MSQGTEQVEDTSTSADSVLDQIEHWYHIPVLVVLLGYMLWVRLQSYGNFLVDRKVYFSGNDAWYHLRQVQYTVNHWPATMPFDPWTYYPHGTSVGQSKSLRPNRRYGGAGRRVGQSVPAYGRADAPRRAGRVRHARCGPDVSHREATWWPTRRSLRRAGVGTRSGCLPEPWFGRFLGPQHRRTVLPNVRRCWR